MFLCIGAYPETTTCKLNRMLMLPPACCPTAGRFSDPVTADALPPLPCQELLLLVLAAAAPSIPHVVKPAMPPGVQPGELLEEEAAQLFRAAGGEGGKDGEDGEDGEVDEGGEDDHVAAAAQPQ